MRKALAYGIGLEKGHEFVSQCSFDELVEAAEQHNVKVLDVFGIVASEAFESFSQFSPWEFTAAEFNASRDPDGVWAAFERGMSRGAEKAGRAIVKAYEAEYKAQNPNCIQSLSMFNVSDKWSMSYCPNMGGAWLLHEIDEDGEYITLQYECQHRDWMWATPVRKYKVRRDESQMNHRDGGYGREYVKPFPWMRVYLDDFTWRGGNISECQRILVENGTIKV